jgi:hypothetical protein
MPFKKVTNSVGGTMPTIEPGTYTVTVLRIEDMEPGQYGERMRWVLALHDEDASANHPTYDMPLPYEEHHLQEHHDAPTCPKPHHNPPTAPNTLAADEKLDVPQYA